MKSKKKLIIISVVFGIIMLSVAVCYALGAAFDKYDYDTWYDDENVADVEKIKELKKGMPLEDVVGILGKPLSDPFNMDALLWRLSDGKFLICYFLPDSSIEILKMKKGDWLLNEYYIQEILSDGTLSPLLPCGTNGLETK